MCWVIYDCRKSNLGPAMFCVPWPNNVCFPDIFNELHAIYVYSVLIKQKESANPKFHFPNATEQNQKFARGQKCVV